MLHCLFIKELHDLPTNDICKVHSSSVIKIDFFY